MNELDTLKILANIDKLESLMLRQEQVDCPVYHHHFNGLYIREVFMPAGTFAIGHYQKTTHLNIFLKGQVHIISKEGVKILDAPMIFEAPPGRKVGYISKDVSWLNIYPTTETNITVLEDTFLDKSAVWMATEEERLQAESLQILRDIEDYKEFIKDKTAEQNKADHMPFPCGTYNIGIYDHDILGKCLYVTGSILQCEIIAPARLNGEMTPFSSYIAHSIEPTAEIIDLSGDLYYVAKRNLNGYKGGTIGDRITINYREAYDKGILICQQ